MCTQLLAVVQSALRRAGIHDVRYLDDFFIARSREALQRHLALAQFALVVNPDKTAPSQRLSVLAFFLDSVARTVSCTPERVVELTELLRALCRQRVIQRRHAESLTGELSFAAKVLPVLPGPRPFLRRMLDTIHACKSRRPTTSLRIGAEAPHRRRLPCRGTLLARSLQQLDRSERWRSARSVPFVFASDARLDVYFESTPTPSTVDSAPWSQHLR